MFYAFVHTYGGNIRDGGNGRMGVIVQFADQGSRDEFVDRGPQSIGDYHYREALASVSRWPNDLANIIDHTDWQDYCQRTGWPE